MDRSTDIGKPKAAPELRSAPQSPAHATPVVPLWPSDVPGTVALEPLQKVNERCIELLANAARSDRRGTFPLVIQLRDTLPALTSQSRLQAASQAVLLVEMEFTNLPWWEAIRKHPGRASAQPVRQGSFPRASAVQLGRATLMLVWHSLRADGRTACLFGITPAVAEVITAFSLTEMDRILERRFRHVRPRWEDRPAVWHQLLQAAQSADARQARDVRLRALQLITGELWAQ